MYVLKIIRLAISSYIGKTKCKIQHVHVFWIIFLRFERGTCWVFSYCIFCLFFFRMSFTLKINYFYNKLTFSLKKIPFIMRVNCILQQRWGLFSLGSCCPCMQVKLFIFSPSLHDCLINCMASSQIRKHTLVLINLTKNVANFTLSIMAYIA